MTVIRSDHPSLEQVIREEMRMQRLRSIRELLVHILAIEGVLLWIVALWPRVLHTWEGRLAAFSWPILFVSLLFVLALEASVGTRQRQLMKDSTIEEPRVAPDRPPV